MISKFEEYIRNKAIILRSKRMLSELKTFIWHAGRAEAMSGANDDAIMAAAIGVWIRDTFLSPSFVTTDIQKKMLSGINMNRTYNNQIDGASKDPVVQRPNQMSTYQKEHGYRLRMPRGKEEDLSWLISKG